MEKDKNAIRFLEELSWLLASYSNVEYKKLPKYIDNLRLSNKIEILHNDECENIHFLVGVLPKILMNENIFPSNQDIAFFSQNVLGIPIKRFEKISKYEIIGHIVCSTTNLDDAGLYKLVKALKKIGSNENTLVKMVKKSNVNNNYSWNELIQELNNNNE